MIATLLPMLTVRLWWIRAFDFPRIQVAVTFAVVAIGYGLVAWQRRSWWDVAFVALMIAGLVTQLFQILPYTPLATVQAERQADQDADEVELMIANVLLTNREVDRLVELVEAEEPDMLLVVETDAWWLEQLSAKLGDRFPHAVEHPLDNTYGMALYSRLELVEPKVRFLIQDDIPSIETRVKLEHGGEIQLYCLHPRPPGPTEADESTPRDAELLVVAREVMDLERPVIVAGDMNDVAWSHTTRRFQRISRLLDPRIGRGIFATYNAKLPLLRWPLDHVFFSSELRLVEMQRLGKFGSDHFPILIRLSYEPDEEEEHAEPEAPDQEDREEAQEVIEEAKDAEGTSTAGSEG